MLNIVLLEPEIPQNTGNIARTCAAIGAKLILIEPLGFKIDDKHIKRAGMDYWNDVDLITYKNYDEFLNKETPLNLYFVTTKGQKIYSDQQYAKNSYLVFGKESKGVPEELLINNKDACVRVPMLNKARSLNLSNTVAILAYEILRQNEFTGLQTEGHLHSLNWD